MPYRLKENETPAVGMMRLAEEQLDRALSSLEAPDDVDGGIDEAIHDARKRFKKIRAAVRLVRDEVGEVIYQRNNQILRDAGRRLSLVRDSQVWMETLDDLKDHYADLLDEEAFATLRANLAERHKALVKQVVEDEGQVDAVIETLHEARTEIQTWPIAAEDFSAFAPGLKRVYKRGRKAMAEARSEPSTENLHEWRKRVKYLWYHLRILKRLWPDVLDEWADAAHELANILGDDHDLAVLGGLLADDTALLADETARRAIAGLIQQRRQALQVQAWPLGDRLYTESPSDFVARMAAYWQAGALA